MKKSELKAIIRECLNESTRKTYLSIGVPFGKQDLAWDDLYDDFDSLTAAISKAYRGAKQFHRGYESMNLYWFSYEMPDKETASDLESNLPAMAKKVSSELAKAIKHSRVEVV